MSKSEKQKIIRNAMSNAKGDDLERATLAFGHMTPAQLGKQYGQSGQTHQEVWDGYKRDRDRWEEANSYLEEVLKND
jgi:hypothetical protein